MRRALKWTIGIVAGLFLLFLLVPVPEPEPEPEFAADSGMLIPAPPSEPAAADEAATADSEPQPAPPPVTTWQAVREWTGDGDKNTELVRVASSEWRVIATRSLASGRSTGFFGAVVYNANGERVTTAVNTRSAGVDTSYVHAPPGEYRVEVSALGFNWSLEVEDRR